MKRILIVYNTVSGSTAEMADIIKAELERDYSVDMAPVTGAPPVGHYDAVIIGSPMRFGGFSRPVRMFIRKNKKALIGTSIFCFLSILYIVKIEQEPFPDIESFIDPSLEMKTVPGKMASIFDKIHSLWYYHSVISKTTSGIQPVSMGYLHGRLFVNKLGFFQRIFMRFITSFTTKEREGEFMNLAAVKEWASVVSMKLKKAPG